MSLNEKIEQLRTELNLCIEEGDIEKVLEKSQELDKYIVMAQKEFEGRYPDANIQA